MTDVAEPDASTAIASADAAAFELRAGALRLALRADLGGAVAGLWHGDTPILRSTEPARLPSAHAAAMFPLVPYSNRLGYRRFRWRGQDHSTRANVEGSPHSLHGLGWQRPWQIVSSSALEVVLELRHSGDADWPFAFTARQYFALDAASFSARLQLTNDAAAEQPVGLGWHPYFIKRARSRMHIELSDRWDADATLLPTRKVAQHGIDSDLSHLDFDNCFEGWRGPARIRDERFSLQLTSSLPYLVVYTPPERGYFCVEPVSHVSNAIHMAEPAAHGLVALAPAATLDAWLRLDVAVL
jgi:aldose 1-epimerase